MNFFTKLFGGRNSKSKVENHLEEVLQELIDKSGWDVSFEIKISPDNKEILFNIYGNDEELLTQKDGLVLDSLQLFMRRALQNSKFEERVKIIIDCNNFRERSDQSLLDLAEKLKSICLKKKKPVYFRAFPPRERKIIHQYLSEDSSIKSKSVGEGLYKKIKVFPADMPRNHSNKRRKKENNEINHVTASSQEAS